MQPVIIWDFHIYGIVYECSYVQYIVLLTFTFIFKDPVSDFCSPPHTSVSHWSNLYCGCVTADIVKGSKTDLRPVRWFILNGVSVLTQERKDQITQPRRWTQVTGECDNTGKISAYIACVLLLTFDLLVAIHLPQMWVVLVCAKHATTVLGWCGWLPGFCCGC